MLAILVVIRYEKRVASDAILVIRQHVALTGTVPRVAVSNLTTSDSKITK